MKPRTASILFISGGRRVGKTTFCRELVELGRAQNLTIAGLLSPARFSVGPEPDSPLIKTGIEAEDLRTGQRRLLATNLEKELNGSRLGPWTFDDQVFVWGNDVLKTATPCDVLVIDELGPLEFDRQQGWSIGFDIVDRKFYRLAVIVVRPEYLEQLRQRWPTGTIISLEERSDTRSLAMQIIAKICEEIKAPEASKTVGL